MSYQMAYTSPVYNQQQEQGHYPSPAPSPNHYQQPPQQQHPIPYPRPPNPYQPHHQQYPNPYQHQTYPFQASSTQTYPQQQQQQQQNYVSSSARQQQQNYHQPGILHGPPPAVPAHLIVPSQRSQPYPQEPVFPLVAPSGAAVYAPQTPQSHTPATPQSYAPITPQSNASATPHPTPPHINTAIAQSWPFNLGPTDIIELQIHAKDAHTDLFIPSSSPTQTPLYTAIFQNSPYLNEEPHVKVYNHSSVDQMRQVGTCMYHSTWSNRFKMSVLGSEWEFDTHWVSDVGTCQGRHLEWTLPKKQSDSVDFTLHCVDTQDNRKVICSVEIEEYSRGHIQIPGGVVKDQRGLDEMVTVAVCMLQRVRTKIRNEGAGAVRGDAAGKVDTGFATNTSKAEWQDDSLASGSSRVA